MKRLCGVLSVALLSVVSAWAQNAPQSLLDAATSALDGIDRNYSAALKLETGGVLFKGARGDNSNTWVPAEPRPFLVQAKTHSAFRYEHFVPVVFNEPSEVKKVLLNLDELTRPYREACEALGGSISRYPLGFTPEPQAMHVQVLAVERARTEQLLGQFSCVSGGATAFVYTVNPQRRTEAGLLPPGTKLSFWLWSLWPESLNEALTSAQREVDAYRAVVEDFRRSALPGAQVAVPGDSIGKGRTPLVDWYCGLMVERKEGVVQIQVDMKTVFVPTVVIYPPSRPGDRGPGRPPVCTRS